MQDYHDGHIAKYSHVLRCIMVALENEDDKLLLRTAWANCTPAASLVSHLFQSYARLPVIVIDHRERDLGL